MCPSLREKYQAYIQACIDYTSQKKEGTDLYPPTAEEKPLPLFLHEIAYFRISFAQRMNFSACSSQYLQEWLPADSE